MEKSIGGYLFFFISKSGAICNRNVPTELKGKFYCSAIFSAILYGSECWV